MEAPQPLTSDEIEAELRSLELLNKTSVEIFGKIGRAARQTQFDDEIDKAITLYEDIDPETIPDSLKEKLSHMTPHIIEILRGVRGPDGIPKALKLVKKTLEIFSPNPPNTKLRYTGPTINEIQANPSVHRPEINKAAEELLKSLRITEEHLRQNQQTLPDPHKQLLIEFTLVITNSLETIAFITSTPGKSAEALTLLRSLLVIVTTY